MYSNVLLSSAPPGRPGDVQDVDQVPRSAWLVMLDLLDLQKKLEAAAMFPAWLSPLKQHCRLPQLSSKLL